MSTVFVCCECEEHYRNENEVWFIETYDDWMCIYCYDNLEEEID